MSTRKTNNSILVLATLGVYLGLVLIGATPQVLAQTKAQLAQVKLQEEYFTRLQKENTDEINKPLSDANFFVPQFIHLVNELGLLSKKKKFDWKAKTNFLIEGLAFCESDNSPAFLGSGPDDRQLSDLFDKYAIRLGREILKRRSAAGLGDVYSGGVDFDLSIQDGTLVLKTLLKNQSDHEATAFARLIHTYFESFASSPNLSEARIIYDGTLVSSDNNQIQVVTRLPRAGLDALLASSAK